MDKVSIIIPCYNQGQYLSEAVDSALAQTYKNIEVIIVDDASWDNTEIVSWKYIDRARTFKHIHNRGLSAARNTGIAHSTGNFIMPLDADDKIDPTFVEKALTIIKSGREIVAAGCQEFGLSTRQWAPKQHPTHTDFLFRNQINHCALFKKEMWERLGGYDEHMRDGFEDWDFWTRSTGLGYTVEVISEPLFLYRKRGESMVTHAIRNKEKIVKYMRDKYEGKTTGWSQPG